MNTLAISVLVHRQLYKLIGGYPFTEFPQIFHWFRANPIKWPWEKVGVRAASLIPLAVPTENPEVLKLKVQKRIILLV